MAYEVCSLDSCVRRRLPRKMVPPSFDRSKRHWPSSQWWVRSTREILLIRKQKARSTGSLDQFPSRYTGGRTHKNNVFLNSQSRPRVTFFMYIMLRHPHTHAPKIINAKSGQDSVTAKVQSLIYERQNPSSCETRKYFLFQFNNWGMGSDLHTLGEKKRLWQEDRKPSYCSSGYWHPLNFFRSLLILRRSDSLHYRAISVICHPSWPHIALSSQCVSQKWNVFDVTGRRVLYFCWANEQCILTRFSDVWFSTWLYTSPDYCNTTLTPDCHFVPLSRCQVGFGIIL